MFVFSVLFLIACGGEERGIYSLANGCYEIYHANTTHALGNDGQQFKLLDANQSLVSQFRMQPSDLGQYLLYDQNNRYMVAKKGLLFAQTHLASEMSLNISEDEQMISPGEWQLHYNADQRLHFLQHIQSQQWLSTLGQSTLGPTLGLQEDQSKATALRFVEKQGCADYPEADIAATGEILKTHHENGTLWGYVDAHEHIQSNYGFSQRIFHGASFHKLGIEHALHDCKKNHGKGGNRDIMGIVTQFGGDAIEADTLAKKFVSHLVLGKASHNTQGYPDLTDWSATTIRTHQQLYYKWIERAYLSGLRLMVDYMVTAEVICDIVQTVVPNRSDRRDCNEMTSVDRQIAKTKEMQDYIDAHSGGPGKGWFRIVYSAAQAREVIGEGKLAVILGLEVENPFNCFAQTRTDHPPCDETIMKEQLHKYHEKGIRALFPSHKFVNGFSDGDGDTGFLEVGDYLNAGKQWRDYIDCDQIPSFYTASYEGNKTSMFSGLGRHAENSLGSIYRKLFNVVMDYLPHYQHAHAHCQAQGLKPLGYKLMNEMMKLGMIIDLGHAPKAALAQMIPILIAQGYPAVNTHYRREEQQAMIKDIKGFGSANIGNTCRNERGDSAMLKTFRLMERMVDTTTGLPRTGISYDFNGFANYESPRFGPNAQCALEQRDPIVYPFKSIAGDVEFRPLITGNRTYDFNLDGLAHIGLFPELIEEARRAGATDTQLNLLFSTAEAYVQLWERAESVGQTIK